MDKLSEKFAGIGVENAPGQEVNQVSNDINLIGEKIPGNTVDFSHGDVNAFKPIPGAIDLYQKGFHLGGDQAYTEYKGKADIREAVAKNISKFTQIQISAEDQLIITPGTQGALFLAMGSVIGAGDKVAIVFPDYFANRKIARFLGAEIVPIALHYYDHNTKAGLDLLQLEDAFKAGVKVFLFSNPNNPTGVIYSPDEIASIAAMAREYDVTVIVDQLYSRQIFKNKLYTHLCAQNISINKLITIMGPSKTESLSGFRLGVAFGSPDIINRMEKLQAIVSLRTAGYNQAVLNLWFNEPEGWIENRIKEHKAIRDDLLVLLRSVEGVEVRSPEAGSYLFIKLPEMKINVKEFIRVLRIQAAVTMTPGTEFGPQFTESVRINFSQDHQSAVEAIKRTVTMIERYRK